MKNMNFTHEYPGSPTIPACQAAIALATVAAPFAATGMDYEQAAKKAVSLMHACETVLSNLQLEDLNSQRDEIMTLSLEQAQQHFRFITQKGLQSLVQKTLDPSAANQLWAQAIAGQKVFTREVVKQMERARQLAAKERGVSATAARNAKQAGKASRKK